MTAFTPQPEPVNPASIPAPDKEALTREVEVRLLYDSAAHGTTISFLLAIATVAALWDVDQTVGLLGWFTTLALITGARAYLAIRFFRVNPPLEEIPQWERRFINNATMAGICWGTLAVFFYPQYSHQSQVFLAFLLTGLSAGSAINLSSIKRGVYAFSIPCLLPLTLRLLTADDSVSAVMGIMIIFYLFTVITSSGRIYAKIHENIALRLLAMSREQELQQAQDRLTHLLTTTPVVIYSMDSTLRLEFVSHNAQALLGFPADAFVEGSRFWVGHIHHEDQEKIRDRLKLIEQGGQHQQEYRFRTPIGQYIWILDEFKVVEHQGRSVVVGYWADITLRKETERTLNLAKKQAEEASAAKSHFLSRISHELRTPLNAILGFTQILEMEEDLNSDQKQAVSEISHAGHHLLDLVDGVLELTRNEAGRFLLEIQRNPIRPILEETVVMLESLARQNSVTLTIDDSVTAEAQLFADRRRLKQIILNLLSNAIKYNVRGGTVTISTQTVSDRRMRIVITDSGPGIAKERLVELFQPFSRLDAEYSEVKGTGMGLVIAKSLVQAMQGDIGVDSEPGSGSRFWIELPINAFNPD